jgi:hypothetical protein
MRCMKERILELSCNPLNPEYGLGYEMVTYEPGEPGTLAVEVEDSDNSFIS